VVRWEHLDVSVASVFTNGGVPCRYRRMFSWR
jgi:hypothetical protein